MKSFLSTIFTSAALAALHVIPASAQSYPERPVRVVVPFPAGGAADIVARQVIQGLSAAFGSQFVVDNRGGAGGAIGAETVARAAPDGYTLLFASSSALSINPHIAAKLSYDAMRDFSPIALIGFAPNVLVVHPSVPAKSVKELIAVAKSKPGALNFASNGTGTLSHLTGELFMQRAGVKMVHVPYKGAAPAVIDTMAGNVSVLFAAFPSVSGQERAGKLRALAVTSAQRTPELPEVPTMEESGFRDFQVTGWFGLFAPAKTPPAAIDRIYRAAASILATADIKARFAELGGTAGGEPPQQFRKFVVAEKQKWAQVAAAAKIQPE